MEEMNNSSLTASIMSSTSPAAVAAPSSAVDCERWVYEPAGYEYTVLIGPAFFLFFTATGIPLGILADVYSRKVGELAMGAGITPGRYPPAGEGGG